MSRIVDMTEYYKALRERERTFRTLARKYGLRYRDMSGFGAKSRRIGFFAVRAWLFGIHLEDGAVIILKQKWIENISQNVKPTLSIESVTVFDEHYRDLAKELETVPDVVNPSNSYE